MDVDQLTYSPEHVTRIVTAGGWGRSGKGTSMAHLKTSLEQRDRRVVLIDQGIKFRVMCELAMASKQPLDNPSVLDAFIRSAKATQATLEALDEVSTMDKKAVEDRLYTPAISKSVWKIGRVASSHDVAVGLLRTQVETAVEDVVDFVLIDGRSMEKYAKQYTEAGLARFVVGWFFKCDPAIAARRSLGLFGSYDELTVDERQRLLAETLNISDRNRSDTLREVDPMREPMRAYHLDLTTYTDPSFGTPYKRANDIRLKHSGLAVVDTSYTLAPGEMTRPFTEVSLFALMHNRALTLNEARTPFATSV